MLGGNSVKQYFGGDCFFNVVPHMGRVVANIIHKIIFFTVVAGLSACGGGSTGNPTTNASTSDSNDVTDSGGAGLTGGIENFKSYTAGPATFINIKQSDGNTTAYPSISSISTIDATQIVISKTALVTIDEGSVAQFYI